MKASTIAIVATLLLLVGQALSAGPVYYGIRVAKRCGSMLLDNLNLWEEAYKELERLDIGDVTDTQGDWWSLRTLSLQQVRSTDFVYRNGMFLFKGCRMLPTGHLQVDAEGEGFLWRISFNWKLSIMWGIPALSGQGTAEIASSKVDFVQSYNQGQPSSNVNVKWKVLSLSLGTMLPNSMLESWVPTLLQGKLANELTFKLNLHSGAINRGILEKYQQITTKYPEMEINVLNNLINSTESVYINRSYVTLLYGGNIVIPGHPRDRVLTYPASSPIDPTDEQLFDFQVCYNLRLFSEYLDVVFKTDHYFANVTEPGRYGVPSTLAYYKAILPRLESRYSDLEKIRIECQPDHRKSVQHLNFTDVTERRMLVPERCSFFVVSTNELILDLFAVYSAKYRFEMKRAHLFPVLTELQVNFIEAQPRLDAQGTFVATELADKVKDLLEAHHVAPNEGFYVDSVRGDRYEFRGIDERIDDVCMMFADVDSPRMVPGHEDN